MAYESCVMLLKYCGSMSMSVRISVLRMVLTRKRSSSDRKNMQPLLPGELSCHSAEEPPSDSMYSASAMPYMLRRLRKTRGE
ncbi:hypothetical protein TSOC_000450 [Tetrabaena socialis]|uniref:Uncharacterized protein n=1 Tax=Tetrabaena socialis TaxID=47790 RepID=A0A2J8AJB7_9CHLO|nr:hypothetical protein TSOC_000450 [Tetrabaena socialis]|eukprot:PNH12601.1 hypothetical protein TSOC_000450 [Tetrabaena socialis]